MLMSRVTRGRPSRVARAPAGDDKHAATLVGAAEAHRFRKTEDPVETRLTEAFLEPARTRCGTDPWNTAAREGSALTFEAAIAYAVEEPPA
jgi:hypothetical protein